MPLETTTNKDRFNDERDVLILGAEDVQSLLVEKEHETLHVIECAYQAHSHGQSALPHSLFLHFPNDAKSRIIALPAYLGGPVHSAGVKWISSFPENVERGIDRASAMLILNSMQTGRPKAVLEGSIISAKRTAASAALAARTLHRDQVSVAGMIGCGVINIEIARFLVSACPGIQTVLAYDLDLEKAHRFKEHCQEQAIPIEVRVTNDRNEIFRSASLISFATTAGRPHIDDLALCAPGTVVLHVSLRDLSPKVILSSDNVVDDVDHVCRAQTSIHLTEQQEGHRRFVRCTLGDILNKKAIPRRDKHSLVVFSPFGLGILDIALGEYVLQQAFAQGRGLLVPSFLPKSWNRLGAVTAASSGQGRDKDEVRLKQ